MNRVAHRTTIAMILVVVLVAGLALFLLDFTLNADDWTVFQGNPHVYTGSNIGCGTIYDRDGEVLLSATEGRVYSENETLRKATIHWLGDRYGYISAPAVTYYADELAGFDLINGVYSFSGTGGEAELTISAKVQKAALEAMGSKKGTVAVYNYKTGEILCAVTTPTYDPDNVPQISDDDSRYTGVYLNRFTQSTYTPGSIFKVFTSAAALESLGNAEQIEYTCTGSYSLSGGTVTCPKKHGTVDMSDALACSCNCYFAYISQLMGEKTVARYAEKFSITESVTFDGITTAAGNFDVSGATEAELAWSCIGQHVDLINPCRMLTFMGAIAGGGSACEPYIVAQAGNYTANVQSTGRIMSKDTAATLREMMRNNVVQTYGKNNFPGLTVCAKSGTAQVEGQKPNATFAGFVTDEDYPLAFVVFVENAGSGADTCVPIISEVLEACKEVLDNE